MNVRVLRAAIVLALVSSMAPFARAAEAPVRTAPDPAPGAIDLVAEARALAGLVSCAPDLAPPPELDARAIERYCKRLAPTIERYRRVRDLIARPTWKLVYPPELPPTALHVFGAGDLAGALTTYLDAKEVVTLSPEAAGDPRRVSLLTKPRLDANLARLAALAERVLGATRTMPGGMAELDPAGLPMQLSLFLLALEVHGYEPVALRFFRVEDDGTLRYLDDETLRNSEPPPPKGRGPARAKNERPSLVRPDAALFASSELWFAKKGDPAAGLRVHRHLAVPLDDVYLRAHPGVLRWLEGRGPFTALAKGGTFQLWLPTHATFREWLLAHLRYMVSDVTGVPPALAKKAGLVQQAFGRYLGQVAPPIGDYDRQWVSLFSHATTKAQVFRYGVFDKEGHVHLVVTRPPMEGVPFADLDPASWKSERVVLKEELLGGRHFRLWTDEGAIHVFVPPGYRPKTAGTVIYAHGYWNNVEEVWNEHDLAGQFAASAKNALFIVPEAATSELENSPWEKLDELLEVVGKLTGVPPSGPIVLVAHSGGYRTVLPWLEQDERRAERDRKIVQVFLLDGFYGTPVKKLRAWLTGDPSGKERRLVLTSTETADRSAAFARTFARSAELPSVPEDPAAFGPAEKKAQVVYLASQFDHMGIVTQKKVIPVVLQLSPLASLPRPAGSTASERAMVPP